MSDYIPPELIPNILARLPVEDVLRCTSVCKSWYELITCPSFASSHLNMYSPNQEPQLLVQYCKKESSLSSYCLHCDNQTFDEIAELDVPVGFRDDDQWEIIDSSNGLFCLYYIGTIVLWNPSLRKSLILPKSRLFHYHTIGFGFVAASNEYKVLKLPYASKKKHQAEIYQLSTGSWRDVKHEEFLGVEVNFEQAHLNGILHWSAYYPGKDDPTFSDFICSFDLKKEKFGTLMVPSCLRHDAHMYRPVTLRELLCLIDETSDGLYKIWVMKEYGISDSWQNLIVIDKQQHRLTDLLYFRHNGEILFNSFDNRKLVVYDCNNKQVKSIELFADGLVTSIHTYVESLALINGPN